MTHFTGKVPMISYTSCFSEKHGRMKYIVFSFCKLYSELAKTKINWIAWRTLYIAFNYCWESYHAGCPQGGQSVSKNGLAIFFLHGMPAGQTVSRFGSGIFFFFLFFVIVTNLHISLFIKLSPLLGGMYFSLSSTKAAQ